MCFPCNLMKEINNKKTCNIFVCNTFVKRPVVSSSFFSLKSKYELTFLFSFSFLRVFQVFMADKINVRQAWRSSRFSPLDGSVSQPEVTVKLQLRPAGQIESTTSCLQRGTANLFLWMDGAFVCFRQHISPSQLNSSFVLENASYTENRGRSFSCK